MTERTADLADKLTMMKMAIAPPKLTSYGSGWKDINLEFYSQPPGETLGKNIHHHVLIINTGPTYTYQTRLDGRYHQGTFVSGNISLYPAMQPMPYCWSRDISIIFLSLSQNLLTRNSQKLFGHDRVKLRVAHNCQEPLLRQMGLALKAVLESNSTSGSIYAQTMANAIAVHLLQHFSTQPRSNLDFDGGLSMQKLKRVLRYIDHHLEQKITLKDLAAIAQLSQHHFARTFKQTTGSSPHQYLIRRRINRAQQLLKRQNTSISEVAIACGFSNQGHLHRHFKKHLGVTPKQFYLNGQYFSSKIKKNSMVKTVI